MSVLTITVITLVMLVVIGGGVILLVRAMARRNQRAAEQEYPNARHIEPVANFFGQQSRGIRQLRGNGTLILTDSELIFKQWVTNKVFRIPLSAIQAIENPTSFLGKWQGAPLLKIVYSVDGGMDAMAWRVRDLNEMMRLINEARG